MIKNVGVDLIEVERIAKVVDRGDGFARKVLTDREFAQYQDLTRKRKIEYLGGRFAVKEAFSKAWGTGIGKAVAFEDVETLRNDLGAPVTRSRIFKGRIFSSIAHDDHEIVAIVMLEEPALWRRAIGKMSNLLSWRKNDHSS
ncbi:holo-[acyl-carrier-protein] synthase [Lactobacillus nasalidis]|uniref:Holo-[acyl-carrier-protein] synthase n=1 Tax=Lactobacillus nasalidis TaxID=2797258 RepID=A0ABQ3W3Y1_9LACO|nr:holo-ACP synthase [Lactobacillus nasalidis]GHV98385.1 holo-[acyl-carrier-protein] synthase [Lactobacillus nasalidis]GHW00223.1 holo-[acyl-carrier-protein] synthase [Lactobacillus nasalidis]GHW01173.1 holo-[acyl-carrier-protein] synthase [Lactobacillus nasalidis]